MAVLMTLDATLGDAALYSKSFQRLAPLETSVKKKFLHTLCAAAELKETSRWDERHWSEICFLLPILLGPIGDDLRHNPFAQENEEVWDNLFFLLPILVSGIGEDQSPKVDSKKWVNLLNLFFTGLDKDTPGLELFHKANFEYLRLLINFYDPSHSEEFWGAGGAKYIFDFESFPPKAASLILTDWISRTPPEILKQHLHCNFVFNSYYNLMLKLIFKK